MLPRDTSTTCSASQASAPVDSTQPTIRNSPMKNRITGQLTLLIVSSTDLPANNSAAVPPAMAMKSMPSPSSWAKAKPSTVAPRIAALRTSTQRFSTSAQGSNSAIRAASDARSSAD